MKKTICLVICLLFVSCTNRTASYSIMRGSTCKLPCWYGIVPGETTYSELSEFVSTMEFVDKNSLVEINSTSDVFQKQIRFFIDPELINKNGQKIQVEVSLADERVVVIAFFGYLGIEVDDIVKEAGEPEGLFTLLLPQNYKVISILSGTEGLVYQYRTYDNEVRITGDTPLNALILFPNNLYDDLTEERLFSMGFYNEEETSKVMYPWDGYGNLDEKYPPRQP